MLESSLSVFILEIFRSVTALSWVLTVECWGRWEYHLGRQYGVWGPALRRGRSRDGWDLEGLFFPLNNFLIVISASNENYDIIYIECRENFGSPCTNRFYLEIEILSLQDWPWAWLKNRWESACLGQYHWGSLFQLPRLLSVLCS